MVKAIDALENPVLRVDHHIYTASMAEKLRQPLQGNLSIEDAQGDAFDFGPVLGHRGLSRNLISLSQLASHPRVASISFNSDSARVYGHEGELLLQADLRDGLYEFQSAVLFSKVPARVLTTTVASSQKLLHDRLGHPGLTVMRRIAQLDVADGIKEFVSGPLKELDCRPCKESKMVHQSFDPRPSRIKATRPLEILHADSIGPISVTSHNGNVYATIITDEKTNHVWAIPIPDKASIPSEIMKLYLLFETSSPTPRSPSFTPTSVPSTRTRNFDPSGPRTASLRRSRPPTLPS